MSLFDKTHMNIENTQLKRLKREIVAHCYDTAIIIVTIGKKRREKRVTFLKERVNHAFIFFLQVHYKPHADITIKIKCLLFPTGMSCSFYYTQISQTYCHHIRTQLSSYTKFITCKLERIADLEAI